MRSRRAAMVPGEAGMHYGNRLLDSRTVTIAVPRETAFAAVTGPGGKNGWYFATWLPVPP